MLRTAAAVSTSLVMARLRAERWTALLVFGLVLVTALLFSGGALLFERAVDAGLRGAVAAASPVERNLEFSRLARIEPGSAEPFQGIEAAGTQLASDMPASVSALVHDGDYVIESAPFIALDAPRPLTRLRFRYQSGVEDQIAFVDGRPPSGETATLELSDRPAPDGSPHRPTVYEVALSSATAETLALAVGDRLVLAPDESEAVTAPAGTGILAYAAIEIVGVFDIVDPDASYWLGDPALQRSVAERVTMDITRFHATALFAPEAYGGLYDQLYGAGSASVMSLRLPFRYAWRYRVDPARLDGASLDTLVGDLTRLQAAHPFRGDASGSDIPSLRMGLLPVIEDYRSQRRTSEAALALAAMGPAGTSAGAIGLVALIQLRRRREGLQLVKGRGAPPLQVLGAQLVEGLMMAVPAALLGYAGATALLGPASTASPATGAIAVAVVTVAVLLLAALPMARSPVGSPERENAPGLRGGPRRLVLDTLVVVVALVGVASLHNRGLLGEAGGSEAGGVDPFLAAVPLLMGIAAGVLAQRVYPLPMRFLAWLAASRRGLVPSLALRTASRDPGVARLPLLVLLLATAMGVFSSVLLVTIERGQVSSTWQEIGADYRIDPGVSDFLPRELDVGSLPGVEAVATAHEDELRFLGGSLRYEAVTVQALDVPAYAAVVSGSPIERPFPTAFILGPAAAAGTASSSDDPLPAMLSRGLAARSGLAQGDTFALSLPGGNATFAFLGLTEGVVGLPGDDELVLVPTAAVDRASPRRPLGGPRLFIRAPASSEEALRNAVLDAGSTLRLASRPQIFARLHDAPLPAAVRAGLGLALAVALGYAALTVAAGAALALATRRRELAILRTLGLGGRNAIGLIVLEYAPVILVALAAGLVLGLAMAWLLAPALELETFTGLTGEIAPQVDWGHVILLGVAPIAVVSIAVLLGAWLAQRADLARAVRSVQD